MAKYTLELRELFTPIKFNPTLYNREDIESWFSNYELTDYLSSNQIETINKLGIWNKSKLAKKIVDHYYMRELGFETPMLFQHYAKLTMQEIMEKYLPLIYSASIEYDILVNVDYKETFTRNATKTSNIDNSGVTSATTSGSSSGSSNGNTSSTSNSNGLGINNDTPQGQINKQTLLNGTYATSTSVNDNTINDSTTTSTETLTETSTNSNTETTSNSQGTDNALETYTKTMKGNSGVSATAQKMIAQYRDNIIAIDNMIIHDKEIQNLFMGLY